MGDDASFVEEIRRSPDDIVPRLIYADYLEDRGDPRGELIRVQCELHELEPGTPGRADLFNRERELLEAHGETWLAPLRELGVQGISVHSFQRGLLEHARISVDDFVDKGERLCRETPALTTIQLRGLADSDAVTRLLLPMQISALELSANRITNDWWIENSRFLASDSIRTASLQMNQLGGDGSIPFYSVMVTWPHVRCLNLGANRFGASSFGSGEKLSTYVEHLDLHCNPLGNDGLERCLSFFDLRNSIEHLNVSGCDVSSARTLAQNGGCPNLKELIIRNNNVSVTDWDRLIRADSELVDRLEILDTRNNPGELPTRGI